MNYYYGIILFLLIFAGCPSSTNSIPKSSPLTTLSDRRLEETKKPLKLNIANNEHNNSSNTKNNEGNEEQEPQVEEPAKTATPSPEELDEARKELAKQLKIYEEQIKPNLSNEYSGFHTRFAIFNEEDSFLTRLTPNDVLFYAELSDLAYVKKFKDIEQIELSLFEKLAVDKYKDYLLISTVKRANNSELSAAILYSKEKNHIIIVFRGSVSRFDWFNNFTFTKYTFKEAELTSKDPKIAAQAKEQKEALSTLDGQALSVHRGYANIYLEGLSQFNQYFKDIIETYSDHIINNPKPLRITTTGHSLGGALALIKANDLPRILLQNGLFSDESRFFVEVISYGAPRVYDEASSRKVEQNLRGAHNIIRFAHEADPVPNLPTVQLGGADIGVNIYLPSIAYGIIKNPGRHMMGQYIKASPDIFKKIKEEFLFARQTKNTIIRLKKILGDTRVNSFDKPDAARMVQHLLDENIFKKRYYKKILDSSPDNEEAREKHETVTQTIQELNSQLKTLK